MIFTSCYEQLQLLLYIISSSCLGFWVSSSHYIDIYPSSGAFPKLTNGKYTHTHFSIFVPKFVCLCQEHGDYINHEHKFTNHIYTKKIRSIFSHNFYCCYPLHLYPHTFFWQWYITSREPFVIPPALVLRKKFVEIIVMK